MQGIKKQIQVIGVGVFTLEVHIVYIFRIFSWSRSICSSISINTKSIIKSIINNSSISSIIN